MSRLQSEFLRDTGAIGESKKESVKAWDASQKQSALQEFDGDISARNATLPPELEKLFQNGKLLLQSGELQLARRVFLALLQKQPEYEPAHHGLLQALHAMGDLPAAFSHLKARVESQPSFSSYFDLAEHFYHAGDNENAEKVYAEALRYPHVEGPALFCIYKNLGNIALLKRDFAGAEEQYSKAYTLNDRSDVLLVNFGSLAIQRGQIDRALTCYRRALELNSANAKAWIGLAVLHREFGDYELSWANVERAMDFEPGNTTAAKLIAEWGLKDNEVEKTIRLLRNYLEIQPRDAFLHMMLGKYLYLVGQSLAALDHLQTAVQLDSQLQDADSLLAVVEAEVSKAGMAR